MRQLGSPGKSQDPFQLSRLGRGLFHDTLSVAFRKTVNVCIKHKEFFSPTQKLDPVGSTVRYEMMKLCTGSVQDTMRRYQLVIDDTGSVEGIYAFIYCTKWRSGQVLPMPDGLTDFER